MTGKDDILVEARDVSTIFGSRRGFFGFGTPDGIRAVDGVSLVIRRGETLGLVGESGSGKSTLGRTLLHLRPATKGSVLFDGHDLARVTGAEMRDLRRRMQIVFQDPYSSLHPRMTVRQTITEAIRISGRIRSEAVEAEIHRLARAVGLGPVHVETYPFRLSGGQRQRVAIARALAMQPSFIVADEAVSALDVSIQAQILNLFADIQAEFGLTYLFISHDLNVIRYLASRVAVMYRGRIVEEAPTELLFSAPLHPYTRLLLSATPGRTHLGPAEPATAAPRAQTGCLFRDRCPVALPACAALAPPTTSVTPTHLIACHRVEAKRDPTHEGTQ